jgi:hypothetical protein
MMKRLFILLFIFSIAGTVYAKDVFIDRELKDLRLIEVRDGSAVIQSQEGIEEEAKIGDAVGREGGKVIEIGNAFITIQIDNTRTRLLMVQGFER